MDHSLGDYSSMAWSHDGRWLAVTDADNAIWVMPAGRAAEAQRVLQLSFPPEELFMGLAWSPDDTHIAFSTANHPMDPDSSHTDERVAQVDWRQGTVSTLVPGDVFLEDWSTQNRLLVGRGGGEKVQPGLAFLDVTTGEWTKVAEPPGLANTQWGARWTADEQIIVAYTVGTEPDDVNKRREVYLLDWKNRSWKRLPVQFTTFRPGIPVLSPDGRRIAWTEEYFRLWGPDDSRIMLYDLVTGERSELLWMALGAGSEQIKSASSVRSELLARAPYYLAPWQSLVWAPDSRRLAFVARRYKGLDPYPYTTDTIMILTLDQPCPSTTALMPNPAAP